MCRVFVFSNVVYSPDTSNCSKRSNLYTACCTVYQFNFTLYGSRRGRTSAQMGCLAITPSLMRWFHSCASAAKHWVAVLLTEQPWIGVWTAVAPLLRQSRLSVRLRDTAVERTDSFNANESVKHAYFIQYVSVPHFFQYIMPGATWVRLKSGPCGGCRVFKLAARFSFLAVARWLKSLALYDSTISYFQFNSDWSNCVPVVANGRAPWFYLLSRPCLGGSVDIDI